ALPWRYPPRACFFFSSRRRHTRFSRDWSSDVCSSDLLGAHLAKREMTILLRELYTRAPGIRLAGPPEPLTSTFNNAVRRLPVTQIGRASCRERAEASVAAGSARTRARWSLGRRAGTGW